MKEEKEIFENILKRIDEIRKEMEDLKKIMERQRDNNSYCIIPSYPILNKWWQGIE